MSSLRSAEGKRAYDEHLRAIGPSRQCALCEKPSITEFVHWKIMENAFPYDLIASLHHMLVLKRHASETELFAEERDEIAYIKTIPALQAYDWIIEPTQHKKSIPGHMHLHLLVGKPLDPA